MLTSVFLVSLGQFRLDYYDVDTLDDTYGSIHSQAYKARGYPLQRKRDNMGVNDKLGITCHDMSRAYEDADCCASGAENIRVSLSKAPGHWPVSCADLQERYYVTKEGTSCCGASDTAIVDAYNMERREWDRLSYDPDIVASQMRNDDIATFAEIVGDKIRARGHTPIFSIMPGEYASLPKCARSFLQYGFAYKDHPEVNDPACGGSSFDFDKPQWGGIIRGGIWLGIAIAPTCKKTKTCRYNTESILGHMDGTIIGMNTILANAETGKVLQADRNEYPKDGVQWMLDDPVYSKVATDLGNGRVEFRSPTSIFEYGVYKSVASVNTNTFSDVAHMTTFLKMMNAIGIDVELDLQRGTSGVIEMVGVNNNLAYHRGNENDLGWKSHLFAITYQPVFANGTLVPRYHPDLMYDWIPATNEKLSGDEFDAIKPLLEAMIPVMQADDLGPFPPFADFKDSFDRTLIETQVPIVDWTDMGPVFWTIMDMERETNPPNPIFDKLVANKTPENLMALYVEVKRRLLAEYHATKDLPFRDGFFHKKAKYNGFWTLSAPYMIAEKDRKYGTWAQRFHSDEEIIGYHYQDATMNELAGENSQPHPTDLFAKGFESMQELYEAWACRGWDYKTFTFTFGEGKFSCP